MESRHCATWVNTQCSSLPLTSVLQDIRNLLADWADDVASSELIWIRASVSNKRIFYDYDDAVIKKGASPLFTLQGLTETNFRRPETAQFPISDTKTGAPHLEPRCAR